MKEKSNEHFWPEWLLHELFSDLSTDNCTNKIKLLGAYTEAAREYVDGDMLKRKVDEMRGMVYYKANRKLQAIIHFELALFGVEKDEANSEIFQMLGKLIQCHRSMGNYAKAFEWVDIAFDKMSTEATLFDKLVILDEYVSLLKDAEQSFFKEYIPVIIDLEEALNRDSSDQDDILSIMSLYEINQMWQAQKEPMQMLNTSKQKDLVDDYLDHAKKMDCTWYKQFTERIQSDKLI